MSDYYNKILRLLPQKPPFRFVDEIVSLTADSVHTRYTFPENAFFYEGHFPGMPVTPGAMVTEAMVQGGLAALAIHLMLEQGIDEATLAYAALTSAQADFLRPVFPKETITVQAQKIYFRFNKIKCHIVARNAQEEKICEGVFSGMMVTSGKLQA